MYFNYLVFFTIIASIYALLTLGLNIQWGYTGLFNVGIAGFFAIGAYTSTILTKPPSPNHLGGFSQPFIIGLIGASIFAGLIAALIGIPTLRLKEDYLAIVTLGIAEIIRLLFKNESWLSNGKRGIRGIPQPLHKFILIDYNYFYVLLILSIVLISFILIEKIIRSPWGRVLRAIREDEKAVMAIGRNVFKFKMQALILGSMIMGLAGALYAHQIKFISPDAFEPMLGTFIIWIMLIAGGSGNNMGAILGAFGIWGIWTGTEFLTDHLPAMLQAQSGSIRIIIIGLILEVILLIRPAGILGEERHISTFVDQNDI